MKIIKSKRKTLTLKLDKDGEIVVKAPYLVGKKTIENFVEKHRDWIEKRQKDIFGSKKKFEAGEIFFFLGNEFPLYFDDKSKKLHFDGEKFVLDKKYCEKAKEKFEEFYKSEAKDYISNRVNWIAKQNNLSFNKLGITSAKSRRGSCSNKKNLNFTYRLIMTPLDTIDYVIIHELAHLKEMNHSKRFRQEVEKLAENINLKNYKIHKKWLKDNGSRLYFL